MKSVSYNDISEPLHRRCCTAAVQVEVMKQWEIQNKHSAALYNILFLKVQTAFSFSRGRIAVVLLDMDGTVLFGSSSLLILKQPGVFCTSEVQVYADLLSFLIQKIFLNVLKKGQIFYHQIMLLHFNMCLANACAVAYQG